MTTKPPEEEGWELLLESEAAALRARVAELEGILRRLAPILLDIPVDLLDAPLTPCKPPSRYQPPE